MGQSGTPQPERLSTAPRRDDDIWAVLNESLRSVKAWWRAHSGARAGGPAGNIDLTEPEEPGHSDLDALVEATSEAVTERIAGRLEAALRATRESMAGSLTDELGRVRHELEDRDDDLARALDRVADSYDRVVTRLEHDRRERRMLAEAVLRLERRLSLLDAARAEAVGPAEGSPEQHVIGGTVEPPQEPRRLGNGSGRVGNAIRPSSERR